MSRSFLDVSLAVACVALVGCYPKFGFDGDGGNGGMGTSGRATVGAGGAPGGNGGGPILTVSSGEGGATTTGHPATTTASTSTGTSTSTGVVMDPFVSCGDGNEVIVPCTPGQICCFHESNPANDECQTPNKAGDCTGSSLFELECDSPDDCMAPEVCCVRMGTSFGDPVFEGPIECAATCANGDRKQCESDTDCAANESCYSLFQTFFGYNAPEYANTYRICYPD